jgi:hypothetical protein
VYIVEPVWTDFVLPELDENIPGAFYNGLILFFRKPTVNEFKNLIQKGQKVNRNFAFFLK